MFKEAIRALTTEQKTLIEKSIKDNPGATQKAISELTKIPSNYIRAYFHLNGHNNTNRKRSKLRTPSWADKDRISKIMPLYENGHGVSAISKMVNIPYNAVARTIAYNRKLNSTEDYIPMLKYMIWDGLGIGFSDIIEGNNGDYQRLKYIGNMIDRQFGNSKDKSHARQALIEKLNLRGDFINMLQAPGADAGYGNNAGESMIHHFDENPIKSPNTVLTRNIPDFSANEDNIANMLLEGKSIEDISNALNVSKGYVSKIISERGIQYSLKGWSEESRKRKSEKSKLMMEQLKNNPVYKKRLSDAAKARWERVRQEKAKQVPAIQNTLPVAIQSYAGDDKNQYQIRQLRELQDRLRNELFLFNRRQRFLAALL